MKQITKKGQIILEYKGLTFNISEIEETIDGDVFSFTFSPYYDVIEIIPKEANFEGIQGLDLDLGKRKYERTGIPTFVSERIPPQNREELYKELQTYGLDYYDPFELMVNSNNKYCGDNLKVRRYVPKKRQSFSLLNNINQYSVIKDTLNALANGDKVVVDDALINPKQAFLLLYPVYIKEYNRKIDEQQKSAKNRLYKGRQPININKEDFAKIYRAYKRKQMSIEEAITILDISKSTFFRMAKKSQK